MKPELPTLNLIPYATT